VRTFHEEIANLRKVVDGLRDEVASQQRVIGALNTTVGYLADQLPAPTRHRLEAHPAVRAGRVDTQPR
jgi:hypothetical protein